MVFEHIEKLKQTYTDQYVVVHGNRPELRRFQGQTGQVKTVNMNGRALVQFDAHSNIGWYDIELDYLKVVDKPLPKEPAKKRAAAAKKTPSAKAGKKAPAAMSAADVLAAARGGGAKTATPKPKADASKMSAADVLAAARGKTPNAAKTAKPSSADRATTESKPSKPSAKMDPTKMSVEDILAAARGKTSAGAAASTPKAGPKSKAGPKPKAGAEPNDAKAGSAAPPAQKVDPKKMSVDEILAAARSTPGGGSAATSPVDSSDVEPEEAPSDKPTQAPGEAKEKTVAATGDLPEETADIIAWCREHDG